MKPKIYNIRALLWAAALAVFLSGCASREQTSVGIADFNSLGEVNYGSSVPVYTKGNDEVIAATTPVTTTKTPETTTTTPVTTTTTSETTATTPENTTTTPENTATTRENTTKAPETTTKAPENTTKTPETTATTSETTTTAATQTTTTAAVPVEIPDNSVTSGYSTVNYTEIKGVWLSFIEWADMLTGQSRDSFTANISAAFDNCVSLGVNTVYVHVRSHSDAYYRSELFPWSKYAAGTIGADPGFDPLKIIVEQAHKRSLSVQAWINPLRGCAESQLSSHSGYPFYTFANGAGMAGKYAVNVNGTYFLNPAYDEVRQLICSGAAEILTKYEVDGLHIDDYFYPTTESYFDSSAFNASGNSDLSAFRFANCDKLVSELYTTVKKANPTAVFSVSVQGKIENNYTQLYADVRKWCENYGYLDVIIPQLYYGFENSSAPFSELLNEWDAIAAKRGIPLVTGISPSKIGLEDVWAGAGKTEWQTHTDILARQLALAKETRSYGGFALYSYRSVFTPDSKVSAAVSKEISALKELI